MQSSLKLVDCIIEVHDARISFGCWVLEFILRNAYLGFVPILGTELIKHLNFLDAEKDKCILLLHEVTFGKLLGHLRMRADCQGNQPRCGRVGTFSPNP